MGCQLFIIPSKFGLQLPKKPERIRKLELFFFSLKLTLFLVLTPWRKSSQRSPWLMIPFKQEGDWCSGIQSTTAISKPSGSAHQTPNELRVNSLHYKLKLSGVYKSGATSLLATWFCYMDFSRNIILIRNIFFFWKKKIKESFSLPGEREMIIFDKIQLSKNWKNFMRMKDALYTEKSHL